jgi:hypothetical protein
VVQGLCLLGVPATLRRARDPSPRGDHALARNAKLLLAEVAARALKLQMNSHTPSCRSAEWSWQANLCGWIESACGPAPASWRGPNVSPTLGPRGAGGGALAGSEWEETLVEVVRRSMRGERCPTPPPRPLFPRRSSPGQNDASPHYVRLRR